MDINQRTAKSAIATAMPAPIQGVIEGFLSIFFDELSVDPDSPFFFEPVDWVESVLVKDTESEELNFSVSTVLDSITGLYPIA